MIQATQEDDISSRWILSFFCCVKDCEINVSSYSKSEGKQYSEISEVCACVYVWK